MYLFIAFNFFIISLLFAVILFYFINITYKNDSLIKKVKFFNCKKIFNIITNQLISWKYFNYLNKLIKLNGINVSVKKIYNVQIIAFLFSFVFLFYSTSFIYNLAFILLFNGIVFILPIVYLLKRLKELKQNMLNDFILFLNLIQLCLSCGISLQQSLKIVVGENKHTFFYKNLNILLSDLQQGRSTQQAWDSFAQRCDNPDINIFCVAVIQAQKQGISLINVIEQQAHRIQNTVFARAEKKAMALPTKLIFPIVIFIFPITFIILSFPLIYDLLVQY